MIYVVIIASCLAILAGCLLIMSSQRVKHLCQRLEYRDQDVRSLVKANEDLSNENYSLKHDSARPILCADHAGMELAKGTYCPYCAYIEARKDGREAARSMMLTVVKTPPPAPPSVHC